jgi:hypothetical protein
VLTAGQDSILLYGIHDFYIWHLKITKAAGFPEPPFPSAMESVSVVWPNKILPTR